MTVLPPQMVYGEGFSRADDVDAHELTHAVTERSANLFYYMQSGALNESVSDVFGETVDQWNASLPGGVARHGTDTAAVKWLLGEDVPGLGAIRNMRNPNAFGDPGKTSDTQYYCSYGDGGGVHTNSGVPNHAFALSVDGGTYNGVAVTGIGLTILLTIYIVSLSSGQASDVDPAKMKEIVSPIFLFFAWTCSLVVGFHALNGGRLILYELFGRRDDAGMMRWIFGLAAAYAAMVGLMIVMKNQRVSTFFFWLMALSLGAIAGYVVASRLRKRRHSVLWKLQRISGGFLFITALPG